MKEKREVFWAIVDRQYIPLCADTLIGAKREAAQISDSNITITQNSKFITRRKDLTWRTIK